MTKVRKFSTAHPVDLGQRVVLDDTYLIENNKNLLFQHQSQQLLQEAQETLLQAHAEAERLVEEAKQHGVDQANQERDKVLKQGYDEGFQAGSEAGFQNVMEEMNGRLVLAEEIVNKAFEAQYRVIQQHEQQIQDLIVTILKQVLHQELSVNPQQITELIHLAAERIPLTGEAQVVMHPQLLAILRETHPEWLDSLEPGHGLLVKADSNCSLYELYLKTVDASYDISPDTQAKVFASHIAKHIEPLTAPEMGLVADDVQYEPIEDLESELEQPHALYLDEIETAEAPDDSGI